MEIKTYNGQKATFFIQAKGNNAGKPLKNPIPNCFAVTTDIENAYEIIYCLFKGKAFNPYIKGSVIPFVTISDVKKIVSKAIDKREQYNDKMLKQVELVDKNIEVIQKKLELMKQMQIALCNKINQDSNS